MTPIHVACPNPACNRALSYDSRFGGTTQQCPHCGQQLILPGAPAQLAPVPPVPQYFATATPAARPPSQVAYQHERSVDAHASRRLKMGQGCFAMLAVMFAVAIVGVGVAWLSKDDAKQTVGAVAAVAAGLAGLAAFVFFGYFAVETAHKSQDTGRR